jgi:hypothetical protein
LEAEAIIDLKKINNEYCDGIPWNLATLVEGENGNMFMGGLTGKVVNDAELTVINENGYKVRVTKTDDAEPVTYVVPGMVIPKPSDSVAACRKYYDEISYGKAFCCQSFYKNVTSSYTTTDTKTTYSNGTSETVTIYIIDGADGETTTTTTTTFETVAQTEGETEGETATTDEPGDTMDPPIDEDTDTDTNTNTIIISTTTTTTKTENSYFYVFAYLVDTNILKDTDETNRIL